MDVFQRKFRHSTPYQCTQKVLAVVALLALASVTAGFDVQRDAAARSVRWPSRQVAVFVAAEGHAMLSPKMIAQVTRKAMTTWNEVLPDHTQLVWGGLVASDPKFDIFIRMGTKGFSQVSQNVTAHLRLDAAEGSLERVRIELDAEHFIFSTGPVASSKPNVDLQATLTHQLGHALGLGFSRDRGAAMYYFAVTPPFRKLNQDDIRGARWLYASSSKPPGRLCDACDGDQDCDGLCLSWPDGQSYCTRPCSDHDTCPVGYSCGSWKSGRACLPNDKHCGPERATASASARCANDVACPTGLFCLATGGEGFCTAGCTGFCGGFGQCRQVQIGGQVAGLCLASKNLGFGERCEVAPDCASLACVPTLSGGGRCGRSCAGGCPKGSKCGANGTVCVQPGALQVGWPCASGFDCATGLCVEHGSVFSKVCANSCAGPNDCGEGTGCTPTSAGMFCLPFGTPAPGGPCTSPGACGAGSLCDTSMLPGVGSCAPECDPYSDATTCPAGMRCAWVGALSSKAGACRASGPGGLVGAECSATEPCRSDLICEGASSGGHCRKVCPSASSSCDGTQTCRATTGDAVHLCGPTGDVGSIIQPIQSLGSNFAARPLSLSGVTAYDDVAPKPTETGCAARHPTRSDGTPLSLLGLVLIGLVVVVRRRALP
ncbi:MAG: matrixin family metalloprotease [Myxococcales bacterium]|nr:matrixin family metalloprotease [Myxococcales bacterium]